jgi:hypothetical protein
MSGTDASAIIPIFDMSGAPAPVVDMSGAPAPVVDMSGAPITDPIPPSNPPVQTPVVAAAGQPTLTKELSDAVDGIAHDLSGVGVTPLNVNDLIRFVPRLASLVHSLQVRGSEKRDLVIAAAHVLTDRVVGESERPAAHALVDVVFPPVIAALIDVVAGRVTFQQAAAQAATTAVGSAVTNQVVVAQSGNCLAQLLACLGKK